MANINSIFKLVLMLSFLGEFPKLAIANCDDHTSYRSYRRVVIWYDMGKTNRGIKERKPESQIELVFRDYGHHFIKVFSSELAEHLRKTKKKEVTLEIKEKERCTKFSVEGWDVPPGVDTATGHGCGDEHLAPCLSRDGTYVPLPSPWE